MISLYTVVRDSILRSMAQDLKELTANVMWFIMVKCLRLFLWCFSSHYVECGVRLTL